MEKYKISVRLSLFDVIMIWKSFPNRCLNISVKVSFIFVFPLGIWCGKWYFCQVMNHAHSLGIAKLTTWDSMKIIWPFLWNFNRIFKIEWNNKNYLRFYFLPSQYFLTDPFLKKEQCYYQIQTLWNFFTYFRSSKYMYVFKLNDWRLQCERPICLE